MKININIKQTEIKVRRTWNMSPVAKVHEGNRKLSRTMKKKILRKELRQYE